MIRVLILASSKPSEGRLAKLLRSSSRFEVLTLPAHARPGRGDFDKFEADVVLREVEEGEPETAQEFSGWAAASEAVILLAENASPRFAREALQAGVRAVLPLSVSAQELSAAVEAVAAGLVVIAPDQAEEIYEAASPAGGTENLGFPEALTPREAEVLRLLAEGLGNKEIAARLSISEHTAKFHVASILGKLGAASRTEAVMAGIRRGLIII